MVLGILRNRTFPISKGRFVFFSVKTYVKSVLESYSRTLFCRLNLCGTKDYVRGSFTSSTENRFRNDSALWHFFDNVLRFLCFEFVFLQNHRCSMRLWFDSLVIVCCYVLFGDKKTSASRTACGCFCDVFDFQITHSPSRNRATVLPS